VGLYRVHYAKTSNLPEIDHGLASKQLLNLNALGTREDLLPALTPLVPKMKDRDAAAAQRVGLLVQRNGLATVLGWLKSGLPK